MRPDLVPTPRECVFSGGTVRLRPGWGVRHVGDCGGVEERFADTVGCGYTPAEKNITCVREGNLADEAYELEITASGVTVRASGKAGFVHAWATFLQLVEGPDVYLGTFRDWPDVPARGVLLDFGSFRRLTAEKALRLLDWAAEMKLNTVLFSFGDRFPFRNHQELRTPMTLINKEVRALADHTLFHGMEAIPVLPFCGDLGWLVAHEAHAALADGAMNGYLCAESPDAFMLWRELAEEVLAAFPHTRRFHLGGLLPRNGDGGELPQKTCATMAQAWMEPLTEAVAWLRGRGREAVMWDDVPRFGGQGGELLARDVTLMTSSLKSTEVAAWKEEGFSVFMTQCMAATGGIGNDGANAEHATAWEAELRTRAVRCRAEKADGLMLWPQGNAFSEQLYHAIHEVGCAAW